MEASRRLGWLAEAAAEVGRHMGWAARHTPAACLQHNRGALTDATRRCMLWRRLVCIRMPVMMSFMEWMRFCYHLREEARHSPAEVPHSQAVAAEAAHSPEAGRSPAEGRHTAGRRRRQ